jgi:hypothetical protein
MNTASLKSFAPAVRRQLIEAITRKLDFVLTAQTPDYLTTFAKQVAALREVAESDRSGLIERVAYTWFNRFAALRYIDAKGWHPFRCRVLTSTDADTTQPEILKLTRSGNLPSELHRHLDAGRLNDLLDGRLRSDDPQGEVYRHLVLGACRFYHDLLPDLFEELDDATELLLPDDVLTEHSVAQGFRVEISDDDCAEVEILGWLYQFYISEKKDQVMARKSAVPTEDIPAVTQLFTPHWIVRYLVENSLGRLWLLNRPESRLREHMPYYIEGEAESDFLKIEKPEEIRVMDPAVGSGHMLTYAFDLLTLIYEEEGYAPSEIPGLILRNNLFGVDICPRAAQLAGMALVFKGREKGKRFFEGGVRPRIIELRDVRFEGNELLEYIDALELEELFDEPVLGLLRQFEAAKNFGSLIQPCLDERDIANTRRIIEGKEIGARLFLRETHLKVLQVFEQAEALSQRYHVVVANPPYMGSAGMNSLVKEFAITHYDDSKGDLFAMFVKRAFTLSLSRAYMAMVTIQNWMFLSSFEQLRAKLLQDGTLLTLTQIGFNSFPEMNSKVAQACAFVVKNSFEVQVGYYVNLNDAPQSADKELVFLEKIQRREFFNAIAADFRKIPGAPLAYWAPESVRAVYGKSTLLADFAKPQAGLATGDNPRFQRSWYEVAFARIGFLATSADETKSMSYKWYPCNSGGPFRKWFGNAEAVVNWENDGAEIRSFYGKNGRLASRPQNTQYYFKIGVTWTKIGSGSFAARFSPGGFIFDDTGRSAFPNDKTEVYFLIGLMCSSAANYFLGLLNPTMSFTSGDVARLPATKPTDFNPDIPKAAVAIARTDWDNAETSWDFEDHPFLRPALKATTLATTWHNWQSHTTAAITRMQSLETENNRLFICAYGLQDELNPEVPEDQITLARADARKDIAAFLSYAIGCMMGRYSLDHPGLILANAGDTIQEYLTKVAKPLDQLTFPPDEDGIIPILDGEWFEDDIVARTRDFLRVTFGEETLRENIRFIEESLNKDLRKYFLTDFYKDHLQTYKKRPIYWMVQSPKKGFSALLYLHRYTKDTMNLVLNRYLREYQVKLRNRITHLAHAQANESIKPSDKTAARKESDKLTKVLRECEEWERSTILPLAQQRIELDLDDGVKTNYLKLGEALAPIAGLAATEES